MKALERRLEGASRGPVTIAGPVSAERIARFEEAYAITLPASVRTYVARYGDLTSRDDAIGWRLLGLSDDPQRRPTIASTLYIARTSGSFPADLLPIEIFAERQLACVRVDGSPDPEVTHIDLDDPLRPATQLTRRFSDFASEWLDDVYSVGTVLARARRVDADITSGNRAPDQADRPSDWRSYRVCSQDVVVALTIVRHDRDANVTCVAALPVSVLPDFPRLEPVRVAMGVVLCDAYRSGGTMEIRFQSGLGKRSRPARVPPRVIELLRQASCDVHPRDTAISAGDAATLFLFCARLPDTIRAALHTRSTSLGNAVAFAALSGLWDTVHLEVLLGGASDPDLILRGGAHAMRRLAQLRDLEILRTAVLASTLMRTLQQRDSSGRFDSEDDLVDVAFQYEGGLLRYASDSSLGCSWWNGPDRTLGRQVDVLPLSCTRDTLGARMPQALDRAADLAAIILVPRDFFSLQEVDRRRWECEAADRGVALMVAPDYVLTLDTDAGRRLSRAATTRL